MNHDDKIKEVIGLVDSHFVTGTDESRALIESKLREMEDALEVENTRREAENLAWCLFNKHYAGDEDYSSGRVKFGLCDSLRGVLSQIDNMTVGLVRPHEQVIPPGYALVPVEQIATLEADAHYIFNNPPVESPQIARDVIEWYAGSLRVICDAPTPNTSADALKGL